MRLDTTYNNGHNNLLHNQSLYIVIIMMLNYMYVGHLSFAIQPVSVIYWIQIPKSKDGAVIQ